ncbi:MAG: hypothetical protein LBN26_00940 [Christensenellaceae bacterium]|jgi:hypothetical protein|nr:hypothetical protein [Christensenellaceae bacterium]
MPKSHVHKKKRYSDTSPISSATEATGMLASPPQSEAEREAYEELLDKKLPKQTTDE